LSGSRMGEPGRVAATVNGAALSARAKLFASATVLLLAASVSACAPARVRLPAGPGEPFAAYEELFDQATSACRGVRTLTAELRISGRADRRAFRGTVHAGFAEPASIRLEGVAPFGAPAFILVSEGDDSTLLLPRDNRVLTGEPPAAIVEALTGIGIEPRDLRAVLSGCLAALPQPTGGRAYGNDWVAVDLDDGSTAYIRRRDRMWRLVAGMHRELTISYDQFLSGIPRHVRIESPGAGDLPAATLAITVSQLRTNVSLGREAFTVTVPESALPLSLAELREAGPLRDSSQAAAGREAPGSLP
jgi:outer membrane lipoprotein-sorting protein